MFTVLNDMQRDFITRKCTSTKPGHMPQGCNATTAASTLLVTSLGFAVTYGVRTLHGKVYKVSAS